MKKDPNKYPKGLSAAKVRKIIDYYDKQSDEAGAAEIETAAAAPDVTWVEVPNDLLPEVKKLLGRRRRTA